MEQRFKPWITWQRLKADGVPEHEWPSRCRIAYRQFGRPGIKLAQVHFGRAGNRAAQKARRARLRDRDKLDSHVRECTPYLDVVDGE